MRWWLTILALTTTIVVSGAQPPLTIRWLSLVRDNSGSPVSIRINPTTGLVDLINGVNVDSRFSSVTADGSRIVFQIGSGSNAQIWEVVLVGTNWQAHSVSDIDGDGLVGEDPVDGIDNDGDGRVDEDPGIDNDSDGRVDEDLVDGADNDNDGLVDEDPPFIAGLHPVISADGNHIAFASLQPYGRLSSTGNKQQIYVLDRTQNRIVPISVLWMDSDNDGIRDDPLVNPNAYLPSLGNCIPVYISANGRIVMFLAEWLPNASTTALNIVDTNGDGIDDNQDADPTNDIPPPPNNAPEQWLLLIHDRDADGNGIFDEAGIGCTRTFVASYDWVGNAAVFAGVGSVNISANGRFIAYTVPLPYDTQNPNDPNANRWTIVVRDWQINSNNPQTPNDIGILIRIPYLAPRFCDAYLPTLSDDGSFLAFFMPVQDDDNDGRLDEDLADGRDNDGDGRIDEDDVPLYPDNDGDGQVDEDPVDGNDNDGDGLIDEDPVDTHLDNDGDGQVDEDPVGDADGDGNLDDDGDGKIDEDPPSPPYTQTPMELVMVRLSDRSLLRLTQLFPPSPPMLDTSGYGYSDWWGTATITVDPQNPDVAYITFHSWASNLIDLTSAALDPQSKVNFYKGVPNIFVARFDFANDDVNLWHIVPSGPQWAKPKGLPVSLELTTNNTFRLPLGASLMPTVSFVNGRQLFIVFQSLVPFDAQDANGRWDIYIATVPLP